MPSSSSPFTPLSLPLSLSLSLFRRPQVVPTTYSLKVLVQRSREVKEAGGWVEYFDPDTFAFWYLEKVRV